MSFILDGLLICSSARSRSLGVIGRRYATGQLVGGGE